MSSSVDDALALVRVVRQAVHPAAVVEILRHRQVRKQPAFLEHVADAAPVRRHVDARARIEQHACVERDAAAVRRHQARDHVDDRGLAGAGRAEQRGHAVRGFELRGDAESRRGVSRRRPRASSAPRGSARRRGARAIRTRSARPARSRWRRSPAAPRRHRRPGSACRCRSRPRSSAFRPECWRRR